MVIYKTTNLINGKIYIGKDANNIAGYYGGGKLIKLAINKYGKENFKKEILEECSSHKKLSDKEIYWIKFYNSTDNNIGYNITEGGDSGNIGNKLSEKTKNLISKNNARYWQGKHIPEEVKSRIRKKRAKQDMSYRHAHHILVDSDGNKYDVGCATQFRKEHGMSKTQFYRLIRGEIKEYKGFSLDN